MTPVGPGTTTISVRAADTDGSVVDSFEVSVLGIMDDASWEPGDTDTDATGFWDFLFTTSTPLGPGLFVIVENLGSGPDYTGATLGSISGGTLTAAVQASSDNSITIELTGGAALVGQAVAIRVDDVTNPSTPGADGGYRARLFRLMPTGYVEQADLPPTVFSDGGLPFVAAPIPDQQIFEADGPIGVADLDAVFEDGNGQALTFSILAGNDPTVATGSIVGSQLTLTPTGPGITSFQIEASDLPAGGTGTAVDSFEVDVIGALTNASVTPDDDRVDVVTDYTVAFDARSPLASGDRIDFQVLGAAPDLGTAALASLTGGSLSAFVTEQSADRVVIEVDGGSAAGGVPVTIRLSGVMNPSTDGLGGEYRIDTRTASSTLLDRADLAPTDFVDPDVLFRDDFE